MKIDGRPNINLEIIIALTESEARALEALAGYGDDSFIKHFYEFLGKSYMEPHEKGLRSLLTSIRETSGIPGVLGRMADAKAVFSGEKKAIRPSEGRS